MSQEPSDLGQKPWMAVKRGLFKTKAKIAEAEKEHACNFVVKCGRDSLVWNQYSHRVDAELTFYTYRFQILFLEVFWEQH